MLLLLLFVIQELPGPMSEAASNAVTNSCQKSDQSAQTAAPVLASSALILDCVITEAASLTFKVTEPTMLTRKSVKSCTKRAPHPSLSTASAVQPSV